MLKVIQFDSKKIISLNFVCISLPRFIPESARYLIVKGRIGDCEKTLREIARVNKKEYPDVSLKDPTEGGKHEVRLGDFRDLFRSKSYTHKTLVTWVAW